MKNLYILTDEELLDDIVDDLFGLGRDSDPNLYIPNHTEYLNRSTWATDVMDMVEELRKRMRERER